MNILNIVKDKLFSYDKNIKTVFILLSLAILFLVLSNIEGNKNIEDKKENENNLNSLKYIEYIENKIHKIVSNIEKVGNSEVMLTLESDVEYVYAQEQKKNTDSTSSKNSLGDDKLQKRDTYEESIIIVDKNGSRDALVRTIIEPKIKGVVVVCDNGDDYIVKEKLIDAITTLLNIPSSRVSIIGKKNQIN